MNTPIECRITRTRIWDRSHVWNHDIDNSFPKKQKYWCIDFTDCTLYEIKCQPRSRVVPISFRVFAYSPLVLCRQWPLRPRVPILSWLRLPKFCIAMGKNTALLPNAFNSVWVWPFMKAFIKDFNYFMSNCGFIFLSNIIFYIRYKINSLKFHICKLYTKLFCLQKFEWKFGCFVTIWNLN